MPSFEQKFRSRWGGLVVSIIHLLVRAVVVVGVGGVEISLSNAGIGHASGEHALSHRCRVASDARSHLVSTTTQRHSSSQMSFRLDAIIQRPTLGDSLDCRRLESSVNGSGVASSLARRSSRLAQEEVEQLLTKLLRRETVEEKVNGVVRIGQDVHEQLTDHALGLFASKHYERDAVGQLREEKVQDGYEQHVEDLAFFFRTLVDVGACRLALHVRDELAHVALVGLAHRTQNDERAHAHDHEGHERVDDDVDVDPVVHEEFLIGTFVQRKTYVHGLVLAILVDLRVDAQIQ